MDFHGPDKTQSHNLMKTLLKYVALGFAFALAAAPVVVHAQDKTPAKAEKAAKPKAAAKIDVNSATAADLAKLPGVDADTANRIIAGRPYGNKAQLKSKNVVSDEVYKKITDQIVAKKPKKEGDAAKPKGGGKDKDKTKDKAAK